jgi:hemoglobin
MKTLYERVGGELALTAAIALFHRRVLKDPLTRPFFEGLDMKEQAKKQLTFFSWALGARGRYHGHHLARTLAHLQTDDFSDLHLEVLSDHLEAAFAELSLDGDLLVEVMLTIETSRQRVLGR